MHYPNNINYPNTGRSKYVCLERENNVYTNSKRIQKCLSLKYDSMTQVVNGDFIMVPTTFTSDLVYHLDDKLSNILIYNILGKL